MALDFEIHGTEQKSFEDIAGDSSADAFPPTPGTTEEAAAAEAPQPEPAGPITRYMTKRPLDSIPEVAAPRQMTQRIGGQEFPPALPMEDDVSMQAQPNGS